MLASTCWSCCTFPWDKLTDEKNDRNDKNTCIAVTYPLLPRCVVKKLKYRPQASPCNNNVGQLTCNRKGSEISVLELENPFAHSSIENTKNANIIELFVRNRIQLKLKDLTCLICSGR
jgi:hypothetical protein